jgi:uncharacterized membrane protein
MNIALWIIAGLLAIAYLTVGMMKIVRPYESIVANRNMAWAEDVAPAGVKVIGGIEIIGALGLILPQATGIAELLTPLAASGLIAFQLVASVVHARRRQYSNLPVNVVFAAAALFVAVGRFLHWPGAGRSSQVRYTGGRRARLAQVGQPFMASCVHDASSPPSSSAPPSPASSSPHRSQEPRQSYPVTPSAGCTTYGCGTLTALSVRLSQPSVAGAPEDEIPIDKLGLTGLAGRELPAAAPRCGRPGGTRYPGRVRRQAVEVRGSAARVGPRRPDQCGIGADVRGEDGRGARHAARLAAGLTTR